MEGAWFRATGQPVSFSQQQILGEGAGLVDAAQTWMLQGACEWNTPSLLLAGTRGADAATTAPMRASYPGRRLQLGLRQGRAGRKHGWALGWSIGSMHSRENA